jgi:hypothetical protein
MSAIITIKNKIKILFEQIKFSITIHLGKNPKKGGSPPKDIKLINKQNFNILKLLLNIKI